MRLRTPAWFFLFPLTNSPFLLSLHHRRDLSSPILPHVISYDTRSFNSSLFHHQWNLHSLPREQQILSACLYSRNHLERICPRKPLAQKPACSFANSSLCRKARNTEWEMLHWYSHTKVYTNIYTLKNQAFWRSLITAPKFRLETFVTVSSSAPGTKSPTRSHSADHFWTWNIHKTCYFAHSSPNEIITSNKT